MGDVLECRTCEFPTDAAELDANGDCEDCRNEAQRRIWEAMSPAEREASIRVNM